MKRRKPRDFRAEYRRRKERGLAKGLTLQEARGHGGVRARSRQSRIEIKPTDPLHRAFEAVRKGAAMTPTAKQFHVSSERLRRFVSENAELERKRGRLVIKRDKRRFVIWMFTRGRSRELTVNSDERDRIASYLAAVGAFLNSNNPKLLEPFKGQRVRDVYGRSHPFETDPNRLHEIAAAGEFEYAVLYKGFAIK